MDALFHLMLLDKVSADFLNLRFCLNHDRVIHKLHHVLLGPIEMHSYIFHIYHGKTVKCHRQRSEP